MTNLPFGDVIKRRHRLPENWQVYVEVDPFDHHKIKLRVYTQHEVELRLRGEKKRNANALAEADRAMEVVYKQLRETLGGTT